MVLLHKWSVLKTGFTEVSQHTHTHTHTHMMYTASRVTSRACCYSNQPKIPVLRLKKKGNDEMSIENATFEKQVYYHHHHYYHPHPHCRMCLRMTATAGCAMKEERFCAVIDVLVSSTYNAVDWPRLLVRMMTGCVLCVRCVCVCGCV